MSDFEEQGLKELQDAIKQIADEFPFEMETALEQMVKKFKKAVIEKTPVGGEASKAREKLKNGKALSKKQRAVHRRASRHALDKSYKTEIEGYGESKQMNFWSEAPHFHLVERGHKKVNKKHHVTGFTPGVHMVERTCQEFEEILPGEAEKIIEKVTKKL